MVRKLRWTTSAKIERKNILTYWMQRNKSKTYSIKLNKLFNECAEIILLHPEIGLKIPDINCRKRLLRDFYFVYIITDRQIEIITIWDTRQNPEKLQNFLG